MSLAPCLWLSCLALPRLRLTSLSPPRAGQTLFRQGVTDAQLQEMRDTLSELVRCCHGDDRPDCPILTGLAQV